MNLDTLWQLHKRFLIGVAAGLVVFLIGMAVVGRTAGKELRSAESTLARHKRTLATPAYTQTQVTELRTRLEEIRRRTQHFGSAALPPLRERYVPAAGQSPTQHYIELTGEIRSELIGWALRQNVEIDPGLGLPPQSPTQPQKIARVLRGLDVVERVSRLAVSYGAAAVDNIEITSRAVNRNQTKSSSPLDLTPVILEVVFDRHSPAALLHAILEGADGGGSLGLVRAELLAEDKRKKTRRLVLEFAAGSLPEEIL